MQVEPQSIPAGLLTTLPCPSVCTFRANSFRANSAVTDSASVRVTLQVFCDPEHAPPQPTNSELASGTAVSVIGVSIS